MDTTITTLTATFEKAPVVHVHVIGPPIFLKSIKLIPIFKK